MPLINRIGGSSEANAPFITRAEFISNTEIRINDVPSDDFKYLVIYASNEGGISASNNSKTILFAMADCYGFRSLPTILPEVLGGEETLTSRVLMAIYYGSIPMLDGEDIFSVSKIFTNGVFDYVQIAIKSDYTEIYNFNPNLDYFCSLFW